MTATVRSPSGISQPAPMTFQYSSSPECCAFAGLSQPVDRVLDRGTSARRRRRRCPGRRCAGSARCRSSSWFTCAGAPVERRRRDVGVAERAVRARRRRTRSSARSGTARARGRRRSRSRSRASTRMTPSAARTAVTSYRVISWPLDWSGGGDGRCSDDERGPRASRTPARRALTGRASRGWRGWPPCCPASRAAPAACRTRACRGPARSPPWRARRGSTGTAG